MLQTAGSIVDSALGVTGPSQWGAMSERARGPLATFTWMMLAFD